ncbi:MAG: MSEP-CTERM sorting domain-containing protein [Candidatus Omnitrophica bacterium]|nr:MSEP-CTERM sorting domain-containing protein [Candidatus Omnitrophota bacterium]MBU1996122.1 MSEP-CTERM sorting domain-containing protein [Candidatus Omnitrophota bacterium]MBU4334128.1 MSEP-CTERM sorting domain-containing protein [Candidatus Omnitrophota bacterium]
MNESFSRPLLPAYFKKPHMLWWVLILPQLLLILINLRSFWIISEEVKPENLYLAYTVFWFEVIIVGIGFIAWLVSKLQKSQLNWGWSPILLLSHIGYLWYFCNNSWQVVPNGIEPWVLNQSNLVLYQFILIMPGLFYAGLRIACFDSKLKLPYDFGISVLIAILGPVCYYFFFILFMGLMSNRFMIYLPQYVVVAFFIVTTVMIFFGFIRTLVLSYNFISTKGDVAKMIFAIIIALIGPVAGLLLNKVIPIPADFQSTWVYVLTVINGLIVIIPCVDDKTGTKIMLCARSLTFPFTFYVFIVFLPFLPLALPAMFAIGSGFLFLVPVALFLLHTKRLYGDVNACLKVSSPVFVFTVGFICLSILPASVLYKNIYDRAALKNILDYVYAPDYSDEKKCEISPYQAKGILLEMRKIKEGAYMPFLSGMYKRMVFDDMVLPDSKIKHMYQLFAGEEMPPYYDSFYYGRSRRRGGFRRSGTSDRRANLPERNVQASTKVESIAGIDHSESKLTIEMKNIGSSFNAEFAENIILPKGVFIKSLSLKMGDEMVPAKIFDRKTALWVYHMIRDFTVRDPGILSYETPNKVEFNVYPFNSGEERVAEIEFMYPVNMSPVVKFGEREILLNQASENTTKDLVVKGISASGNAYVAISSEGIKTMPSFKRDPYLHFIIDSSKSAENKRREYIARIGVIASKFKNSSDCKITLANYRSETIGDEYIDLRKAERIREVIEGASFPAEGGFDASTAIKRELIKYMNNMMDADKLEFKRYPVFVIVASDKNSMMEINGLEYFSEIVPESNIAYVSGSGYEISEKELWEDKVSGKSENVVALRIGKKVKVIPYAENMMQTTFFDGVGQGAVLVYVNDENKFVNVDVENSNDMVYAQGVDLMIDNYKLLHNPSLENEKLKTLVEKSRELGLMIPSTSYIVVERSSQWKTLELKEKQRLNASAGLEFEDDLEAEDDFNTPAPSFWLMSFVLLLWFFVKKRINARFRRN